MFATPTMQRVITDLAARHGIDLARPGAHLTLTLPGYMRLAVEVIGPQHISIAHYYELNGDLIPDPDVELVLLNQGWFPTAISQLGTYREVVKPTDGPVPGGVVVDHQGQQNLAEFCELWARNIESQGWLTDAASVAAKGTGGGDDDDAASVAVLAA